MARFKDIEVGQDYEVGEGEYKRYGRVIEKGTFKRTVYHDRSFHGTPTEMQGAKVQYFKYDGSGLAEMTEWVRSQAIGRKMDDAQGAETRRRQAYEMAHARAQRLTGLFQTRGLRYASCYYSQDRGFQVSCDGPDIDKLAELLESLPPVNMSEEA